jgi:hypothetical protein
MRSESSRSKSSARSRERRGSPPIDRAANERFERAVRSFGSLLGGLVTPFLVSVLGLGCGAEDDGVTYADDIRPLFEERCTVCHRTGAPSAAKLWGPNIEDPYAPEEGLMIATNQARDTHLPALEDLPQFLVVAGQPDDSFLINKIADPATHPLPQFAGVPMPHQIEPITAEELQTLETWVADGAEDNAFFQTSVKAILTGVATGTLGKCGFCHYSGTPNPPDLFDPFGPNGLVNVPGFFRTDMLRVSPGDPDQSLLIQRVRASFAGDPPGSEYGRPMPLSLPLLDARQVDQVREWILEGARP